jgi:hypothetical protein
MYLWKTYCVPGAGPGNMETKANEAKVVPDIMKLTTGREDASQLTSIYNYDEYDKEKSMGKAHGPGTR